jgi:hypothetical protein
MLYIMSAFALVIALFYNLGTGDLTRRVSPGSPKEIQALFTVIVVVGSCLVAVYLLQTGMS